MTQRITELETLIKATFGQQTEITRHQQLSQRAAIVFRLYLTKAPVNSVIAKFTHETITSNNDIPSHQVEFTEEKLVHYFLSKLNYPEKIKANLLAHSEQGIMLLEDLGKENYPENRTYGFLIPRLADSLAILHGECMQQYESYLSLRRDFGLGEPEEDRRRYGKPAYQKLWQTGVTFIESRYETSVVRHQKEALMAELKETEQQIIEPGKFKTLIHDDLGNARQTFEYNDRVLLLDFEYAKYSHSLLEFTKLLMGKFELNLETGAYIWTGPHFPMELPETYRQQLAQRYHIQYEDKEWQTALMAAMSYGAITLIGRLCWLEVDRNLKGTVTQNIKAILKHLLKLLNHTEQQPLLQRFIQQYLAE